MSIDKLLSNMSNSSPDSAHTLAHRVYHITEWRWYKCTLKKDWPFSCPHPRCLWPGKIKLFPSRESLVNDIPAGDGKTANLFYSVRAIKTATLRRLGLSIIRRNICTEINIKKTCELLFFCSNIFTRRN